MAYVSIFLNDVSTDGGGNMGANAPTYLVGATGGRGQAVIIENYFGQLASSGNFAARMVTSATDGVRAVGTITLSGLPSNNETMVIGAQTITAKSSGATGLQFNIGADAAATAVNIAALINTNATLNSFISAVASGSTVLVSSVVPGLVGNQIPWSESMTNVAVDGSFLGSTTAGAGGNNTTTTSFANGTGASI